MTALGDSDRIIIGAGLPVGTRPFDPQKRGKSMRGPTWSAMLSLAVCTNALVLYVGALDAQMPNEPQPPSCGNQAIDNRANRCSKLINGRWVTRSSTCAKQPDGNHVYTHCDGVSKQTFPATAAGPGFHVCCMASSDCADAAYVGYCKN